MLSTPSLTSRRSFSASEMILPKHIWIRSVVLSENILVCGHQSRGSFGSTGTCILSSNGLYGEAQKPMGSNITRPISLYDDRLEPKSIGLVLQEIPRDGFTPSNSHFVQSSSRRRKPVWAKKQAHSAKHQCIVLQGVYHCAPRRNSTVLDGAWLLSIVRLQDLLKNNIDSYPLS